MRLDFEVTAQLDESLVPLAIALYIIGIFLKATPRIADWCIPWVLLIAAIVAANVLQGWSVDSTLQGILSCGIAVLGDQLCKQARFGFQEQKEKKNSNVE